MTRFMMTLTVGILTVSTALVAGLPGMRGVDHIGLTVPDMTEAETFFVDVQRCEKTMSFGPFHYDEGIFMQDLLVKNKDYLEEKGLLNMQKNKGGKSLEF